MISMPSLRRKVFVVSLRSYPKITPGETVRKLLPSFHCSRAAPNSSMGVNSGVIFSTPTASASTGHNSSFSCRL